MTVGKDWYRPFALSLSKGSCHGSTSSPRTGQTNAHELHTISIISAWLPPGSSVLNFQKLGASDDEIYARNDSEKNKIDGNGSHGVRHGTCLTF